MDGVRNIFRNCRRKKKNGRYYIQKNSFQFKQKICQIVQHTENYEDAIIYSTKEKRIAMNGNDCYVFDITKLKKYLNIDTAEFIED